MPSYIKILGLQHCTINYIVTLPNTIYSLNFDSCTFNIPWDIKNDSIKLLDINLCTFNEVFKASASQVSVCLTESNREKCQYEAKFAVLLGLLDFDSSMSKSYYYTDKIIRLSRNIKIFDLHIRRTKFLNGRNERKLLKRPYKIMLENHSLLKTIRTDVENLSFNTVPLRLTHNSIPTRIIEDWCCEIEILELRNNIIKKLINAQTLTDGSCNFDNPNMLDDLPVELIVEIISHSDNILAFSHTCQRVRSCTFLNYTALLRTGINDVRAIWHLCFDKPIDLYSPAFSCTVSNSNEDDNEDSNEDDSSAADIVDVTDTDISTVFW
jgi:hypothetical protein